MVDVARTSVGRRNQSDRVKSRRRGNRGKGITVKHDRSDLHQSSEPPFVEVTVRLKVAT